MATPEVVPPNTAIEIRQPDAPTPMALLQLAMSQGVDADKLSRLLDLQERWEKNEARKAFVEAMSNFKAHAINVIKDKVNPQYNSRYVSLGNLVNTVTPFLSRNGLSARWDIDQADKIKVTCIITHTAGHSESVSMVAPPDTSGQKNAIQQIKSAITYAKACTFESICGLASGDSNMDDDGNGSAPMGDLNEHLEWIANACDMKELQKLYANAFNAAKTAKDDNAQRAIIAATNKKKKELQ